jgi:hypothetical protein
VATAITAVITYNNGSPSANGLISSDLTLGTAKVMVVDFATTVVTFTNAGKLPGDQGCTPGFYKQTQAFQLMEDVYAHRTCVIGIQQC